ncbi:hypothetical protein [Botrimarina hoheduenensis]|uniref:Uncharacterized protein n=1 Tax=Botrimarina hoheduenensis TaxID=2528000 RepID=A0A5C5VUI5_9BACT|nr:hypothetical protein [Botrimarina hoheduenensis]TWT41575.1 hypothetical protein Pla111_29520 [Botrimarina hoheduenensis]
MPAVPPRSTDDRASESLPHWRVDRVVPRLDRFDPLSRREQLLAYILQTHQQRQLAEQRGLSSGGGPEL